MKAGVGVFLLLVFAPFAHAQWNPNLVCQAQYVQPKSIPGASTYLVYSGTDPATYRVCGVGAAPGALFIVEADENKSEFKNSPATCVDVQGKKIQVRKAKQEAGSFEFLYCRLAK